MHADESADGAGSADLQTARVTGQGELKHALPEARRGVEAGAGDEGVGSPADHRGLASACSSLHVFATFSLLLAVQLSSSPLTSQAAR